MVVVFRNQNDADMYADNIKKQGGKVFSNKLEKIPYKVVDKKSKSQKHLKIYKVQKKLVGQDIKKSA